MALRVRPLSGDIALPNTRVVSSVEVLEAKVDGAVGVLLLDTDETESGCDVAVDLLLVLAHEETPPTASDEMLTELGDAVRAADSLTADTLSPA